MLRMPRTMSASPSGSGWMNIPLYPTPLVRGLLVYIRGTMTSFSFTRSLSFPSREMYSSTGADSCAEQGPTIISILSLRPEITARTSSSRLFFTSLSSAGSGVSAINSSGSGI